MNLGIIIQARMGSTRLPEKVLLPIFEGKSILEILVSRVLGGLPSSHVVVATTENKLDNSIVNWCLRHGIDVYRGPEDDVLKRFVECSEAHNFSHVIRICADNPFLNLIDLQRLVAEYSDFNGDYLSYSTEDNVPVIKTHYGLWGELVSVQALRKVAVNTQDSQYREHVTNYIYSNPKSFNIKLIPLTGICAGQDNIRLTLDTKEDAEIAKELYLDYGDYQKDGVSLVKELKRKFDLVKRMKRNIKNNEK